MGYVSINGLTVFIPPSKIQKTAGTWTPTIASNLISDVRSAAGAAFTLLVPIELPFSHLGDHGAKLLSVDVFYKIATAAGTGFTIALNKVSLPANDVAAAGAAVAVTMDTAHDTAAECYAVDDHTLTATLDVPAYIEDDDAYYLSLVITAAAGTIFSLFGARANFDLRL
jgi:hypothetical protein